MALIHDAQEWWAIAERERPQALCRLPRTMKQHRSDQVGGVLPQRLWERDEQPPAGGDPLREVGGR
jgi:hypothetical protein